MKQVTNNSITNLLVITNIGAFISLQQHQSMVYL